MGQKTSLQTPNNSMVRHIKSIIFMFLLHSIFGIVVAGENEYPNWQDTLTFHSDLRTSALITNPPNLTSEDYFIGIQGATALFYETSGELQMVPGLRLSIYPSPNYNIWVDFSTWSADLPTFSAGTGIQVEFPGENIHMRKAISLSWNELNANRYTQRDISASALIALTGKNLHYGLITSYDLHHVLVENGWGIPDYDKSYIQLLPYISRIIGETMRMTIQIPIDKEAVTYLFRWEWFLGKRG